jgi:hypothetical protein
MRFGLVWVFSKLTTFTDRFFRSCGHTVCLQIVLAFSWTVW